MPEPKHRPPYLLGLLGLIPIVGAFVGAGLILGGAIAYKSWRLIVVGVLDIALTSIFCVVMVRYVMHNAKDWNWFQEQTGVISARKSLTRTAKKLEFYKFEHGDYPDSLNQLTTDEWSNIIDPMQQGFKFFQYQHLGHHYELFSVGRDHIPHTGDDIYPRIPDSGRIRYGWVKE
jgi:hypothetical protein